MVASNDMSESPQILRFAQDGLQDADRNLIRRISIVLLFVIGFTVATSHLYRMYAKKFFDVTGPARWIWASHQISRNVPVTFYAVREFDLPPQRVFTRIKIAAEPEYALYFNGTEIASRRVGQRPALDEHDVSALAKTGKNRIVVAVRSPSGVGGLLAGVDIAPETENFITTGPDWQIYRRWTSDLPLRNPRQVAEPPMLLGEPPTGRWDYLPLKSGAKLVRPAKVITAREVRTFKPLVRTYRVRSGVQIAGAVPTRATAFDFGFTSGRLRLTLVGPQTAPPLVNVRFANVEQELGLIEGEIVPYAFGAGETTVIDPDVRNFRYVVVYGGRATADVLQ